MIPCRCKDWHGGGGSLVVLHAILVARLLRKMSVRVCGYETLTGGVGCRGEEVGYLVLLSLLPLPKTRLSFRSL